MLHGMSNGWRGFRRWLQRCIRWMRILRPKPKRTWHDDVVDQYRSLTPVAWYGRGVRTIVTSDGEHSTIGTLNASRITVSLDELANSQED